MWLKGFSPRGKSSLTRFLGGSQEVVERGKSQIYEPVLVV